MALIPTGVALVPRVQRIHIYILCTQGTPLESVSEGEKRMVKCYIACISLGTSKTASDYRSSEYDGRERTQ